MFYAGNSGYPISMSATSMRWLIGAAVLLAAVALIVVFASSGGGGGGY
jgi:hypothetical protein